MSKPEYPRVGLMTDAGQARGRPLDTVLSLDLSYGRLVVLADGVGDGESPTAAEIAVDSLAKVFRDQQPDFNMERAVPRFIQFAMQEANREVFKAAQLTASPTEFAASVVLALVIEANAYVGYCGSARMVVLRNGAATRITRDYSTVGANSDASSKPAAARIVKPMGHDPDLSPAVFAGPIQLRTGDLFVLCSDGLYDYLDDGEMGAAGESLAAEEAVVQLVNTAKERGSTSSISVVIYQTEAPAVDAGDDTEGVLVAEADQSPTEPAEVAPPPPPPAAARRATPAKPIAITKQPTPPSTPARPVPWLVVGVGAAALGLLVGLFIWAPWSGTPETAAPKVADAPKVAQVAQNDQAPKPENAEDPGVGQPGVDDGEKPVQVPKAQEPADENDPPAGGRVIEVAPPIPVGKAGEDVKPFKKGGKPVKDVNKLGAPDAVADGEEPAGEEAKAAGGTQGEKGGTADAAARIAVGPKPAGDQGEQPDEEPVKAAKEPVKVAPVKGDDDWPDEEGDAKKPAGGTAKQLTPAEAKKAAAEAKKAEKEAKKKAEAEAKKAAAEAKKAEKEAKKKAAADAKLKKEQEKLTAAELKKAEKEAKKKAEAEAKAKKEQEKLAAAEAKKVKKVAAVTDEEPVVAAAGGCNTKGLKGKSATAVTKTQEAIKLAKDSLKKNDAQAAAQAHVKAVWQIMNNKHAAARCTAEVDEVKAALAANYLKLTEYLAKKKQCKAARGRAKDAAMFGATEAQKKKALGDCFIGSSDSSDDAAPAPKKPAPKKPAPKPTDEDQDP